MSAPSKTFAKLEWTAPIVQVADGIATTTSMRIANGTNVQHKNVLELIRNNLADLSEFGGVASETRTFDTTGGPQQAIVYLLNEEHATLLLTYMRNTDIVRDFKKRLVREFYTMRRGVLAQSPEEQMALGLLAAQKMLAAKDARIAELEPPAAAWTELAEAAGDYSVADAAKVVSRDPNISIGRDRLFQTMNAWKWVYKPRGCGWRAYQDQVDNGRLVEKLAKPYYHQGRDEVVTGEPTVRVTPKGIEALQKRLGGGTQQLALAVAE